MDKSGEIDCMRFTPVLKGSGKWGMAIVGAVLIVVGCITYMYGGQALVAAGMEAEAAALAAETVGAAIFGAGFSMAVNGVVAALASPSKMEVDDSENQYYFNGPVNTTDQGVPIPLVFGRCKVGSRVISSGIEIKQK